MISSKLKVTKLLIDKYRMYNLHAILAKLLNICKQVAGNLANESDNVPRKEGVPRFSDLKIVILNMTSEAVGIDSESFLFAELWNINLSFPILYPADNTMTDVKPLPPSAIQSKKECPKK